MDNLSQNIVLEIKKSGDKKMKKFELGDISEVFVSKIKGGYHVSVCGEYKGQAELAQA